MSVPVYSIQPKIQPIIELANGNLKLDNGTEAVLIEARELVSDPNPVLPPLHVIAVQRPGYAPRLLSYHLQFYYITSYSPFESW